MNKSIEKVVITGVRSGFGDDAVTACAARRSRAWGTVRLALATVALLLLPTKALADDRVEPRVAQLAPGISEPAPASPVALASLMPPHLPAWSPGIGGGGAAAIESPPEPASSLQDVALYATFDDFRQGRVTGRTQARVMPRGVMGGGRGKGEPEQFWALDMRGARARALGKVYAFAAGGEVYVAEGAPRPNRASLYGRLQRAGERGVFMQQVCFPVSQHGFILACTAQLRLLDMTDGTSVGVSRRKLRKWLDSQPELRRRFDDEPRKDEATLQRYLVELLERDPAAVPAAVRHAAGTASGDARR
jgi:hypothetical protein